MKNAELIVRTSGTASSKHFAAKHGFLLTLVCTLLLLGTACGGPRLSGQFNEADVRSAAGKVIDTVNRHDAEGLRAMSSPELKAPLTAERCQQMFTDINKGGAFSKIEAMDVGGQQNKAHDQDFAVVIVKAKYAKRTFTYTLSFDTQMHLAGIYYK